MTFIKLKRPQQETTGHRKGDWFILTDGGGKALLSNGNAKNVAWIDTIDITTLGCHNNNDKFYFNSLLALSEMAVEYYIHHNEKYPYMHSYLTSLDGSVQRHGVSTGNGAKPTGQEIMDFI